MEPAGATGVKGARSGLAGAAVLATVSAALASIIEGRRLPAPASLLDVITITAFAVAGYLFYRAHDQRRTGALLLLIAALEELKRLGSYYALGPLPFLAWTLGTASTVVTATVVVSYPHVPPPAQRSFRTWIVVSLTWLVGTRATVAQPTNRTGWWPHLPQSHRATELGNIAANSGRLALTAAFIILLLARLRLERGAVRREITPLIVAGVVGAVATSIHTAAVLNGQHLAPNWILVTEGVALLGVPLTLLAAAILHQLARLAAAQFLVTVGRDPGAPARIEVALARALRYPDLRLLLRADHERWVDTQDQAVAPVALAHQAAIPVQDQSGTPLALIIVDAGTARNYPLISALTNAVCLTLTNASLQANLTRQLADVRRAQADVAAAARHERRRMERDLHDGFQQRLFALATTIGRVRHNASDADTLLLANDAAEQLRSAQAELRALARGAQPAVLDDGLRSALISIVEDLPLSVKLDVNVSVASKSLQTVAYFVVCEALTNVVRHADANHVTVTIEEMSDQLQVEVYDDGRGGARPAIGSGLEGLADRIQAAGGALRVISPPGLGTRLLATFPIAANAVQQQ